MKPAKRVAIAFGFAVFCLCGFSSLALWNSKAETEKSSQGGTVVSSVSSPTSPPKPPGKPPEEKRHIEELLAQSVERVDPGPAFFVSRIREAVREGNPVFAQELLRQMKEEFSSSILVNEAEEIVKLSR